MSLTGRFSALFLGAPRSGAGRFFDGAVFVGENLPRSPGPRSTRRGTCRAGRRGRDSPGRRGVGTSGADTAVGPGAGARPPPLDRLRCPGASRRSFTQPDRRRANRRLGSPARQGEIAISPGGSAGSHLANRPAPIAARPRRAVGVPRRCRSGAARRGRPIRTAFSVTRFDRRCALGPQGLDAHHVGMPTLVLERGNLAGGSLALPPRLATGAGAVWRGWSNRPAS